jgi:hypothetical protein
MAIKKSVRLSDETENLCVVLSEFGETNWSGTINKIASRYNEVIARALPELSENERLAICQCYNGHMKPERVQDQVAGLEFTISEGWQYDSNVRDLLGDESAARDLLEKVRGWSFVERVAVIDMTERFWGESRLQKS